MRNILDTVVARIQARQRADGYHNYYPEKASYTFEGGGESERKNYDRVFWTRGLLDAGEPATRLPMPSFASSMTGSMAVRICPG